MAPYILAPLLLALIAAVVPLWPAVAQVPPGEPIEVDVELVLAVDVSRSMSPRELEIQRRGYAEALVSDAVVQAITQGMTGQVAIAYMEWAGQSSQRVVIDWRLLGSRADAQAFADELSAGFSASMRRTSISTALLAAADMFEGNGFVGLRRVIDISGDGPNNEGRPVTDARDEVLGRGIIINGLPLMTNDGFGTGFNLADLDEYYRQCVVGGPAAFVLPVTDWNQFADAVRQKLVLELVGLPPPSDLAVSPPERLIRAQGYDCLIGERIWQRNQDGFR
ncbi:MAG: DUF1194 domain-containing protein [Rhodobacteraceae bacterium]|jgi:hypothetical protein|nr:DUF1194 domain-containing protein [Paracoccaceae bacterium]